MSALQHPMPERSMPADVTRGYILDMLEELTTIAQTAGLRDMASILSITLSAAKVDVSSET